jgi:hypothetical protein
MNYLLSDFEKYKAYFQDLATKNKSVAGFLFGDIEIAQEEAGSWEGLKLWAWPATRGRIGDAGSDNFIFGREGSIMICGPCASELHAEEDSFYQLCESIMKQVVSKMIHDRRNNLISVTFHGNTFDRVETFAGSTKLIGCEYVFTIDDPDGFQFNENDWNN